MSKDLDQAAALLTMLEHLIRDFDTKPAPTAPPPWTGIAITIANCRNLVEKAKAEPTQIIETDGLRTSQEFVGCADILMSIGQTNGGLKVKTKTSIPLPL